MSVFIALISLGGALLLNAPFNAEKVAFHGMVDKEGKMFSCEAVTNENRSAIISHINEMRTNNSLNGEELLYEDNDIYHYEYFARNIGGHIFTLTEKDCTEGLMDLGQLPSGTVQNG